MVKIRRKRKKISITKIRKRLVDFFKRLSVIEYIFISLISCGTLFLATFVIDKAYYDALVDKYISNLQNTTVIAAAEYSNYASLEDAVESGMNNRLNVASAIGNVRLRLVNSNLEVTWDTYGTDTSKTLINSKILQIFQNEKTISEFDKENGKVETATPVYNSSDELIAVLIGDLDESEVADVFEYVDDIDFALHIILVTVLLVILFINIHLIYKKLNKKLDLVADIAQGHTDRRLPEGKLTEYKRFASDFNKILDAASKVDDSRSEFVSNVSHELKTPITSIKVLADSLNTGEDFPIEVYKEFMTDIVTEIDRESKIIDDLLALVRMDKSASALNITAVNMNEMLELVLRRLQPIAKKKNIDVLFESFRPVIANIDEVKMTRVITNLVENAIKYNESNGWVHVSLNADHQYFYIKVEDSGMGIPKESQDKVFDRFYRVDKARSRQTGGTGLGLSIVKNIILMHHGTIKLHSEEDVGTVFTIRVPINYVKEVK
ncbi:sensor histidine kinase [Lachnospira multipara]|uniref:histidine kinase n=1 Tax=Lachnospira multipara TaxID=28051 RepID=A0A1H5XA74_9FIRM|nr:HAMP domain-containing sensor histidine kinase [Lachnospira multipara]SEG08652.1 His Kinase A (phospho-acceptor) domain-containing protein [Lachnospira multipara]